MVMTKCEELSDISSFFTLHYHHHQWTRENCQFLTETCKKFLNFLSLAELSSTCATHRVVTRNHVQMDWSMSVVEEEMWLLIMIIMRFQQQYWIVSSAELLLSCHPWFHHLLYIVTQLRSFRPELQSKHSQLVVGSYGTYHYNSNTREHQDDDFSSMRESPV